MILTPEGLSRVVRKVDTEALADVVQEEVGFEISDASYGKLCTAVQDAVSEALSTLDFTS